MGKIKKILENESIGGTQSTDVYPVTSTKAVYDTSNKVLDDYIQHLKKTSTFAGIATPTTNPGTPDVPVFYFAVEAGIYSNFNGISVSDGEIAILEWKGSWIKKTTDFATQQQIVRLDEKIDDKTNEINVAKEEALQAIAENEQSAIANFNSQRVTPEMLSESTKQLIEASGGGTITNLPDDEDLTSVDDGTGSKILKFADRTYNANNFSGKGYITLRKNIQEVIVSKYDLTITSGCIANGDITITVNSVENNISVTTDYSTPEQVAALIASSIDGSSLDGTVVSFSTQPTYNFNSTGVQGSVSDTSYTENRNVLTQSMINKSNTIYEIRYDFDLNGQRLFIPENCIFDFQGGSFNNGIISITTIDEWINYAKGDFTIQYRGSLVNPNLSLNVSRFSSLANILNCYTDKPLDNIIFNINGQKDATFNLDGRNNLITTKDFRIICYNLNIKNVKVQPSDLNSRCIVGNKYSITSFIYDYKCKLRYENCEFINCDISVNNNIEFINCKFINCSITIGLDAVQYNNDNNAFIFAKIEGCEFHYGKHNVNNIELIHISFIGWKGNAIIHNCRFYNEMDSVPENKYLNDWIDLYDSCNASITNCFFYSKHTAAGEGIINVKSHSFSSSDGDGVNTWNYTDKIGYKTNTIISNNIFVFDLNKSSFYFNDAAFIWVRNYRRETTQSEDVFNTRKSVIVTNNTFNIKVNDTFDYKSQRIHMIFTQHGIENVLISNNTFHIDENLINANIGLWGYSPITTTYIDIIPKVINTIFTNNIVQCNNISSTLHLYQFVGGITDIHTDNIDLIVFKDNVLYGNVLDVSNNITETIDNFIIKDNLYKSTRTGKFFGTFFVTDKYYVPKLELGKIVWNKSKNKLGIYIGKDENNIPILVGSDGVNIDILREGSTKNRPTDIDAGFQYFDTTLNKPIWWNGNQWVDATGITV